MYVCTCLKQSLGTFKKKVSRNKILRCINRLVVDDGSVYSSVGRASD